jgi:hypothetical protein
LDKKHYTTAVKARSRREQELEALRRTPVRYLAKQIRDRDFFRWHCSQAFAECVADGRSAFRLTVRFKAPYLPRRSRRMNSLWHPRGFAYLFARKPSTPDTAPEGINPRLGGTKCGAGSFYRGAPYRRSVEGEIPRVNLPINTLGKFNPPRPKLEKHTRFSEDWHPSRCKPYPAWASAQP